MCMDYQNDDSSFVLNFMLGFKLVYGNILLDKQIHYFFILGLWIKTGPNSFVGIGK